MYLKSIEIQGFKSFADRVVLEFHSGITGIVGPNGSGKSNVADAVRWVLGEQSAKQLRGTKMEDIIFAGTQLRKKLGFAYVAMTFDNSDHKLITPYDEVKVARRVYRSGESEYLLNGSVCRLRDVQELFLDTGIGKEGYSIIGQGQIDKILSGRPEERRELFDEAAGIAKFKKRKQDALRNLEAEQNNLVRIRDIISELEIQVGPLKKQAEKAQEFLTYREELKKQETRQFFLESEQIKEALKGLEEKLSAAREDYRRSEEAFAAQKKVYEELEEKEQAQKLQWTQYQQELSQAKVEKEKREGLMRVEEANLSSKKQRREQNFSRKEALLALEKEREQEKKSRQETIAKLTEDSAEILEKNSSMAARIGALTEEAEEKEALLEEKKAAVFSGMKEEVSLKADLERYQMMLDQNALKKADYRKQLLLKKSNEAVIDKELSGKESEWGQILKKEQEYQKKKASITAEHEKQLSQIRSLSEQLEEKQISFHRENSRLESIRNITERYDGFGNSIKRIMEQKHPGVLGVVSDVIRVKKQHELAIEAALGGSIQNIVTDTEETAKQMIAFLKKNKYGRATFLPLTGLTVRGAANTEILKETGVIGYGSTLVKAEEKFGQLVEFLFGRTLVVDTIDHAVLIAGKYRHFVRIVTLEGEVVNVGGAISGGAFRNAGNLLGRRREMEELEKRTGQITEEMKKLREEIEGFRKASDQNSEEYERIDQILQEISLQKNTVALQKEQLLEKKKELEQNFQGQKEQEEEILAQSKGLKEAIADLKEEIAESGQKTQRLQGEIEGFHQELLKTRETLKKVSSEAEAFRMEHAAIMQKLSFEEEHLKRLAKEQENGEEELLRLEEENKAIEAEEEEIHQKIKEELALAKKEEEAIAEKEQWNEKLLGEQKETERALKAAVSRREDIQKSLSGLDKECYRLETQKETTQAKFEELSEYMWKEYQITYENLQGMEEKPKEPLSEIRKQVQKLKELKKALGDVNVNAIEDYRQVSGRYDLMKAQYDDVAAAEESLLKIIEDLDRQMKEQFEEKFQEIGEQFDQVFKELFGGGKGTLELTDDEDVLQAGIRINAQPPGKKLQNMMQLSGGEKSLTAISLLFAIQNLKPSPFCLLDEIEAALDDANVKRFAKYLHKLTKDTQFLVITHRRGTMTAADVLYGITMQEKGISALVSVNLVEEKLT